LTLRISGPGVLAVTARATIKDQVVRLSLLSATLIAALLLAVYRSVPALLLGLVPVASGALAGVAAVALGFGVVHGITLGFGITLIGEAVDYSIYLFIQSRAPGVTGGLASADPGRAAHRYWRRAVWPTIRLGVLTSVCGFAALVPSGFQGLAQLGLYSIAGLTAAALVTRFVLPGWLPGNLRIRDLTALGILLEKMLGKARAARALLALVPLLAGYTLVVHRDALLSSELSALSPISSADQTLAATLSADLGAPDARYMVAVSAPDRETVLAGAQAVAARLTSLVDAGVIGGFDSPTRLLPSLATQRARQASLPAPAELAARLQEALAGLPVSAARLAPFLSDVERARTAPLLTRAALEDTALEPAVGALLTDTAGRSTAFLPLTAARGTDLSPEAIARVRAAVSQAAPAHAVLLDLKGEVDRLYAGYLRQAAELSLTGLAAIVLLLLVAGLSPVRVARVVAPLALAVLSVAGLTVALGERLTILHVVGMLLIVAVGSNYALFFDRSAAAREPGSLPLTLASLLIANLATVMGFGVLAFSSVPVLAALGRTVAPGALLALLFAALLARPPAAGHGSAAAPAAPPLTRAVAS
ncbi:MAG: MMPL family transporter, partial [Steroidobacteraceae bacterium]